LNNILRVKTCIYILIKKHDDSKINAYGYESYD